MNEDNDQQIIDFRNKHVDLCRYFVLSYIESMESGDSERTFNNCVEQIPKLTEMKNELLGITNLSAITKKFKEEYIKMLEGLIKERKLTKQIIQSGNEDFEEVILLIKQTGMHAERLSEIQEKYYIMQ